MTAKALEAIGKNGGPRCCKRDSYLAVTEAVKFTESKLGVQMDMPQRIRCHYHHRNYECLKERCPYYPLKG